MNNAKAQHVLRLTWMAAATGSGGAFILKLLLYVLLRSSDSIRMQTSIFDFLMPVLVMGVMGAVVGLVLGLCSNPPEEKRSRDTIDSGSEATLKKLGLPTDQHTSPPSANASAPASGAQSPADRISDPAAATLAKLGLPLDDNSSDNSK